MATARLAPTTTILPCGQVLVAGGYGGAYLASAELYDPATGLWTATDSMATKRYRHTATLLPNGQVLVAGGFGNSGYLTSAELYDPATGLWTATGRLATARSFHTATLLPNGQVLVAGGNGNRRILASAELYDPASGLWTATGSMATARDTHTATLLPNGQVLVAGGYGGDYLASAELYDSATSALELASAASRKTHGAKGDFDINLPLTGDVGIECRTGLQKNTIVFTFNNDIASVGSATTSCGSTTGSSTISGNQVLVKFNGATCNQSTVTVTLSDVMDTGGNTLASTAVSVGILVGDVIGDGRVGNSDIGNVRDVQGQQTNSSNFRDDVTVDGRINNQDVQTVRSYRGSFLP